MNPKQFISKWINGIKNVSPIETIKARIALHVGNLIGYFAGIITMSYFTLFVKEYRWWWTIVVLIVAFCFSVLELIKAKSEYRQFLDAEKQFKMLSEAKI